MHKPKDLSFQVKLDIVAIHDKDNTNKLLILKLSVSSTNVNNPVIKSLLNTNNSLKI